jgi:hypothetical protein
MAKGQSRPRTSRSRGGGESRSGMNPGAVGSNPAADTSAPFHARLFQRMHPGGGAEDGETFEQAAIRELEEETGIRVEDVGSEIARREFVLQLPDGERVMADERFFLMKSRNAGLSRDGRTAQEAEVMADRRWWSEDELAQTSATVWPGNLFEMLKTAIAR